MNTNLTTNNFSLDFLIQEPVVPQQIKKAIILLHGVGSNEKDLFALSSQLPQDLYVISARGQFPAGADRYAWYQVDFSSGKPVFNADQELSSRELIKTFVREVKNHYHFDEVYLGGFSQGAIMSFTMGLTEPAELTGVISLGGRVLEEIRPAISKNDALKRLKVFIAHGINDAVLPIHYARAAKALMESHGVQLTYNEYNAGHQISPEVLNDLREWLAK